MSDINLFQDRVLCTVEQSTSSDNEENFIKMILNNINKPIKHPKNINLISVNDNYDLYKFEYQKNTFCLKISLDPECEYLLKEYKNLKKINNLISPILIEGKKIKVGEELYVLMTSFENADSIYSYGPSIICEKFNNFCHSYKLLQNSKNITFDYKHHIKSFLNKNNLNSLSKESLTLIDEYTDLNKLQKIFKNLEKDLKNINEELINNKKFICHGNLNTKNILYRNNAFKFINFGDCYSCHCFLDLADLFINLCLDEKSEIYFLNKFCKNFDLNLEENKNLYSICYNIAIRKKLLHILHSYLKETYLLNSIRQEKIIDIAKDFSNNFQRFLKINYFFENKDFIFKTITEPILYEKA